MSACPSGPAQDPQTQRDLKQVQAGLEQLHRLTQRNRAPAGPATTAPGQAAPLPASPARVPHRPADHPAA